MGPTGNKPRHFWREICVRNPVILDGYYARVQIILKNIYKQYLWFNVANFDSFIFFFFSSALFLIRKADGIEDIPEEMRKDIFNEDQFLKDKLQTLKTVITDTFPVCICLFVCLFFFVCLIYLFLLGFIIYLLSVWTKLHCFIFWYQYEQVNCIVLITATYHSMNKSTVLFW